MTNLKRKSFRWSNILSIACLIHCALMPLLLILLPITISSIIEDFHWLEYLLVALSFGLATRSTYHSYKIHHQNISVIILLGIAWILFFIGITVEVLSTNEQHQLFNLHILAGIILLFVIQVLNYLLCKKKNTCYNC